LNRLKAIINLISLQIETNFKNKWYAMIIPTVYLFMLNTSTVVISSYTEPLKSNIILERCMAGMNITYYVTTLLSLVICSTLLLIEFGENINFNLIQPIRRSEYVVCLWTSTIFPTILATMIIPATLVSIIISPSYALNLIPCMSIHTLMMTLFLTQIYALVIILSCFLLLRKGVGLIYIITGLIFIALTSMAPSINYFLPLDPKITSLIEFLIFSLIPSSHLASAIYANINSLPYHYEILLNNAFQMLLVQIILTLILMIVSIFLFEKYFEVK